MAQTIDLTVNPGYPSNGGHRVSVDSSATIDNIFIVQDGANKMRIQPYAYGMYHPSWILNTTGSKTSLLQAMINHTDINALVIDKNFINNGTLTIPTGKKLVFNHGGMISGTGTISGGVIEADENQQIFDATITITGALSSNAKWSPKWMGAKGDGTTNDYAAINAINIIATASSQKIISFPGSSGNYIINTAINVPKGTVWEFKSGAILESTITDFSVNIDFHENWMAADRKCFGQYITIRADRLNVPYNPKQWGAIADFSNNDTASCISMLRSAKAGVTAFGGGYTIRMDGSYVFDPSTFYNYAAANGANTVFELRGDFKINGSWTLRSSTHIIGLSNGLGSQFGSSAGVRLLQNYAHVNMYDGVVVITQGNLRIENIIVQLTNGGSGIVCNGTSVGVGFIPTANIVIKNCSVIGDCATNLAYGFLNSDSFWIDVEYLTVTMSNYAVGSRGIMCANTTNVINTGHTYLMNIRHTVLYGCPIEINAGTTANAYVYGINIYDLTMEVPDAVDGVVLLNSTNCPITNIKIEKVTTADGSNVTHVIKNTGLNTSAIYISDSPGLIPVIGDPVQNLNVNMYGFSTGQTLQPMVQNAELFSSGQYLGLTLGIRKERGWKDGLSAIKGEVFPFAQDQNLFVASYVLLAAGSTITKAQTSHTGGNTAYLLNVAIASDIKIFAKYSNVSLGDRIIMTVWERGFPATSSCNPTVNAVNTAVVFKESQTYILNQAGRYDCYPGHGWQLMTYLGTIQALPGAVSTIASLDFFLSFNGQAVAGKSYIENPTFIRIPVGASFTDQECIEYAREVGNLPALIDQGGEAKYLNHNSYIGNRARFNPQSGKLQYDNGYFKDVLSDTNTIAFDNFTKPNSNTVIGALTYPYNRTYAWVNGDVARPFGISGNKAYNESTFYSILLKASIDVSASDDIMVECDITFSNKTHVGIFVLGDTGSTMTACCLRAYNAVGEGSVLHIDDIIAGVYTAGVTVGDDNSFLRFTSGQTYKFGMSIAGTEVFGYIDGRKILRYTYNAALSGKTNVGIAKYGGIVNGGAYDDGNSRFDNFKVFKTNDNPGRGLKQKQIDADGNAILRISSETIALATDGTLVIPAGTMINTIVVNSASDLAALNIGITVAGTELVNAVPITNNTYEPLSIGKYVGVTTTLYFTGITSSSEIILYYA